MTRRSARLAAGALLLVGGLTAPAFSQSAATATIKLFQFQPSPLEVRTGTKITWTNEDQIEHTVTSGQPGSPDGVFDVKLAGKGAGGSVDVQKAGVYPYFCSRHQSMRGELRVK